MAEYQFDGSNVTRNTGDVEESGLGLAVLIKNAHWFINIRWIIVVLLLFAGLFDLLFADLLVNMGLNSTGRWPLYIATLLACLNPVFLLILNSSSVRSSLKALHVNLWAQILLDLFILTILIHFIGSLETPISFTYLFHIALACIFFSRRESFWVTMSAIFLFLLLVSFECGKLIDHPGIIAAQCPFRNSPFLVASISVATVSIWLVVWYLVSGISNMVRIRDKRLSEANKKMKESVLAKDRQMLRTTHDLKAPFSSMETMIQTLLYRSDKELPREIQELVKRIETRSKDFRRRIQEILLLESIRSSGNSCLQKEHCNLLELCQRAIDDLAELAAKKEIKLNLNGDACSVFTNSHYITILLSNLISNAVTYSKNHDNVDISLLEKESSIFLTVEDHGIGIREDALPHIFDEFYRTSEAAAYNDQSTGIGLAIVKEVITTLGFRISVTSVEGIGTKFSVEMPLR